MLVSLQLQRRSHCRLLVSPNMLTLLAVWRRVNQSLLVLHAELHDVMVGKGVVLDVVLQLERIKDNVTKVCTQHPH